MLVVEAAPDVRQVDLDFGAVPRESLAEDLGGPGAEAAPVVVLVQMPDLLQAQVLRPGADRHLHDPLLHVHEAGLLVPGFQLRADADGLAEQHLGFVLVASPLAQWPVFGHGVVVGEDGGQHLEGLHVAAGGDVGVGALDDGEEVLEGAEEDGGVDVAELVFGEEPVFFVGVVDKERDVGRYPGGFCGQYLLELGLGGRGNDLDTHIWGWTGLRSVPMMEASGYLSPRAVVVSILTEKGSRIGEWG